ncbi:MAG: hypothetical protein JO137_10860 [Hyphomicrobiales bacterium]|nr:hypothetical protein [Hyphomicrobiales bacterium]MBV9432310.1 hypothetical protein [Hyphomicrobiales bacterium]MBV9739673.1 hypothetical protein [Hyphomicrobiales bacterium]MBW0003969.1 hypothetical protein [Hyphomicrobiales bacterium]
MRLLGRCVLLSATFLATSAMAQTAAERSACRTDFQKLCKGTKPGGGRVLACLSQQRDQLSEACRKVVDAHAQK